MAIVRKSYRELATIAEKSAGYSVDVQELGKTYKITNLAFARTSTGRINRAVAVFDCNGKPARVNSDDIADVID